MTIDNLIGLTTEELKALSDEDLLKHYAPVFNLEPKPEGIALIIQEKKKSKRPPKDPNAPPKPKKDKLSKTELLKRQLEELNGLLPDEDEEEE